MEEHVYISRHLESKVERYLDKKEILAIVGPRQSGKTTMLRHIFKKLKNSLFISFEDREKLELFDNDLNAFINLYVKDLDYLFIDEFQYSRKGGKNLKFIFDSYKTKIVISGSSVSDLSINSIKYLVGRVFVFPLHPLSFSEFLQYKDKRLYDFFSANEELSEQVIAKINEFYMEFSIYGGYPRVVLSESLEEKQTVLRNVYNTYILKEIKEILGLKEDYKISRLIHSLSFQIGSLVNYSELCSLVDCNYKELISNINILKKTFVISESRPFFNNKRLELSKNPKLFFLDNGFRNYVINNFQNYKDRVDKGQLNENFVSSEFVKKETDLRYWRTKSKAEIDFIIEKEGKIIPIEVKSFLKTPLLTKSIYSFVKRYKSKRVFILSESLDAERKFGVSKAVFKPVFYAEKI